MYSTLQYAPIQKHNDETAETILDETLLKRQQVVYFLEQFLFLPHLTKAQMSISNDTSIQHQQM